MTKLEKKISIYILLSFFVITGIKSFKCGSKSLDIIPGILETSTKIKKRRIEVPEKTEGLEKPQEKAKGEEEEKKEFKNLTIGYDYYLFDKYSGINNSTKNTLKQLLEEVSELFESLLTVVNITVKINNDSLINLIKSRCKINETSNNIHELVTEKNDITIIPVFKEFESEESEMWMKGKYCLITRDMLPKGGILEINKDINFSKENSYLYFKHIIFHQMTHILIFEPNLMKGLGMIKNNQVISKGVRLLADNHFNCRQFRENESYGVPLEEDGYHWNPRFMLGDYMISLDYYDKVMSDITLALFDDSGLYNVNYLYERYFNFGKNKTCSFLTNKCIEAGKSNFDEFCTVNEEPKCSQSRLSKGKCFIYNYTDNIPNEYQYFDDMKYGGNEKINFCPVSNVTNQNYYFSTSCKNNKNIPNIKYGEVFGNDSFCFISSLSLNNSNDNFEDEAICYPVNCDNKTKTLFVTVNNTNINCTSNTSILTNPEGFKGNLSCPKYEEICEKNSSKICTDMFDCIKDDFKREYIYDDNFCKSFQQHLIFIFFLFIFIIK